MQSKSPENDTQFVNRIVDSVLDCEDIISEPKAVKKGARFTDGFSLIDAYKSLRDIKSPEKTTSLPNVNQKWQIWYWRRGQDNDNKNWEEFLEIKSSFITRKEFWGAYNEVNGYEFGLLSRHFDYCVFKEGIVPMWEDSSNRFGGRWILEFPRKRDWRHISYLDQIWLKVLLAITGNEEEIHNYVNDICGCVLMIRYHTNKIAVWTKNTNNTLVNLRIGQLLKGSTGFSGRMYYMSHDSTQKKIEVKAEQKMRSHVKQLTTSLRDT